MHRMIPIHLGAVRKAADISPFDAPREIPSKEYISHTLKKKCKAHDQELHEQLEKYGSLLFG